MKKTSFKIHFSRISQTSVWKTNFFQKQAVTKFILYENLTTLMILHTKFGLIGRTPGPNQKDLFLQSLIWNIGNVPYEKLIFFPGKR